MKNQKNSVFQVKSELFILQKIEMDFLERIVCIIPNKMNTSNEMKAIIESEKRAIYDRNGFRIDESPKEEEEICDIYGNQVGPYKGPYFQAEEKAIEYHPYVIKMFNDMKKAFDENPPLPNAHHFECSFPLSSIGRIDGLLVDTHLLFRRFFNGPDKTIPSYNARMEVNCSKVMCDHDGDGEYKNVLCNFLQKTVHSGCVSAKRVDLTIEFVNACLNEIKDLASSLKFDKLTSKLGVDLDFKLETSFFGEELCAGVECCVCMEKTFSRTHCEHALCCVCWSSLKKRKCPLCRKGIFLQHESNEEEPEGDSDEDN